MSLTYLASASGAIIVTSVWSILILFNTSRVCGP